MLSPVPWDELDEPIRPLVAVLNDFPGINTLVSCGGHHDPQNDQAPPGEWWVMFVVDRSEASWLSLEFLAWIARDVGRAGSSIRLFADSPPPWLNTPGQMLRFILDCGPNGRDEDQPAAFSAWVRKMFDTMYVDADEAAGSDMARALHAPDGVSGRE